MIAKSPTINYCATSKLVVIFLISSFSITVKSQDVQISIHLRGVHESKISLIPLSGPNTLKPVLVIDGVKNGEFVSLKVPAENLPGEFVLRFDYKENAASTPYPSEKRIIIGNQDLELWVHPVFSNYADSTYFQKDERENTS